MSTEVDQNVASEIRAQLARHRVSQRTLAERLGVNYMWLARRASGEVPATVGDLHLIADALGIEPDVFLQAGSPATT